MRRALNLGSSLTTSLFPALSRVCVTCENSGFAQPLRSVLSTGVLSVLNVGLWSCKGSGRGEAEGSCFCASTIALVIKSY